jgi:hypothetical protein
VTPQLAALAKMMATSDRLFLRALDGADREALHHRPGGAGNPMLWIAGHATTVRSQFLGGLGRPHPLAWGEEFRRGGSSVDESRWPEVAEIADAWQAIAPKLQERLGELTADELAATTPMPGLDDTLLGAITLIAFHDAYHVGQLGMLRAHAGLGRLVG